MPEITPIIPRKQQQQQHAGQLRYHSFWKLREIHITQQHQQQQQKLIRFFWTLRNSKKNEYGENTTTSTKSIFHPLQNALIDAKLKNMERIANNNLNDAEYQCKFLTELANYHPHAVIERINHPVYKKQAALNIDALLLYLQLYTQYYGTNNNSSNSSSITVDIDALLKQLKNPTLYTEWKTYLHNEQNKISSSSTSSSTTTSERKFNKVEQAQLLYQFLLNNGGGGYLGAAAATTGGAAGHPLLGGRNVTGSTTAFGASGTSPKNPVHVKVVSAGQSFMNGTNGAASKASAVVLGFLSRAALVVIAFSAVGALLDESTFGKALSGAVNASNSSNHIQEAATSSNHNSGTGGEGTKRRVKFDDVKGVKEAKAELEEIVMYLKDPSKFTRLGGTLPRGLLLTGPPGTGKTLLAKAIAGEADVPFFYSSGSQFDEIYVGVGAKRIRELFEAAKKKAPAIIFIDEIDAVGGTRKLKDQSALKMTLNELLVQLDGFDENNGIIVIGATNFRESLDPALLRPGRFDKHVVVPLPDVGGRKEILEMYAMKTKLGTDADLNVLARGTTGMSGADLYNLINQAALKASIDGLPAIDMKTLEYAKDKIRMGAERKTAVITAETAKCTAYHEAGHAIVAVLTDGAMPIHKATIMPRGTSLGMVALLPDSDQTSRSYKQMLASMDFFMGGRVAEELIFGKEQITSGAMSDIEKATRLARIMVTKYGFSESIGIVFHGGSSGEETASQETRALIDSEVKRLIDTSYKRAKEILSKHSKEHKLLAETLLEYETLTGDEVRDIVFQHKKPERPIINKNKGARGDGSVLVNNTNKNNNSPISSTSSSSDDSEGGEKPAKKRGGLFASKREEETTTTRTTQQEAAEK